MTSHPAPSWSERLQQQTRNAIEQLPVTVAGCLRFKHATLGYAQVTYDDLCNDRLLLQADRGGNIHRFAGVEELLHAGWALD